VTVAVTVDGGGDVGGGEGRDGGRYGEGTGDEAAAKAARRRSWWCAVCCGCAHLLNVVLLADRQVHLLGFLLSWSLPCQHVGAKHAHTSH
jgi:hypothetical protein